MSPGSDPDPLIEALERLASGSELPEDIQELLQAKASGQVDIEAASGGGIIIKGNVSGGTIFTTTFVLPREVLKLLRQHVYRPPALPPSEVLAESKGLPFGSRMPFLQNAVFTGRREDLLDLARSLAYAQEDGRSLDQTGIVVTGMGGLGKSQLAVEFCYRYGRFFQGVHWLQANLDMQAEVAENGLAMNLPYWPDKLPEQVQVTLKAWQEEDGNTGRRLIVLDNAEDLQVLQDWLPKLRLARLLITSRRENWPVDMGLNVMVLQVLARSQSIELLHKLAARPKGIPDEQLDKLADFLGDLPLALDLAGRYLADRPELSIEGYLAELKETGSALEHTSLRDWVEYSPTRHPTCVAVTFTLSWQQLNKDDELAKLLFKIGGYCAPNIPISRQMLARAVGADVPGYELDRALRKLDSLGLMNLEEGGWRMHSLLAEFSRLQDRDSEESVLPNLAKAMTEISTEILRSGLPKSMKPLREHLRSVAQAAVNSKLFEASALWNNLGSHLREMADYNGAKKNYLNALKTDKEFLNSNHPLVARDLINISEILRSQGKLDASMRLCQKALMIDESTFGPDDPNVARDYNQIGSILQARGDLLGAKNLYTKAMQIDEATYGQDHPSLANKANNLGGVLRGLGDLQGAKECFEKALKIDENTFGLDHPKVAKRVKNLGGVLQALGDMQGAKECFEKALKIDEKIFGQDHPVVAMDKNNIGSMLHAQGKLQQAKECFERALQIDEQVFGSDRPSAARDITNIAGVLGSFGDHQEAKKLFEKALQIDTKVFGHYSLEVALDLNNLGMSLYRLGILEEARKCLERALQIDEKALGRDHLNVKRDINNLGGVLRALGDLQGAKECFERALKIDEKIFGPYHPEVAKDIYILGVALQDLGDPDEARNCYERALSIFSEKLGEDHPDTKLVLDGLISLI